MTASTGGSSTAKSTTGRSESRRAVEEQPAFVDDDYPPAQRLDIGHVVARQQHRGAQASVVVLDEGADTLLHRDVEPDRRLVEEEHLRSVQQGGRDLDLHAFAKR